jgi:hypothetical protein
MSTEREWSDPKASSHEFTHRYPCDKIYRFPPRLYSPQWQLHPRTHANGGIGLPWERVGWDNALCAQSRSIAR